MGFRKVLSMSFIWLFTFQASQSGQAEVWESRRLTGRTNLAAMKFQVP